MRIIHGRALYKGKYGILAYLLALRMEINSRYQKSFIGQNNLEYKEIDLSEFRLIVWLLCYVMLYPLGVVRHSKVTPFFFFL